MPQAELKVELLAIGIDPDKADRCGPSCKDMPHQAQTLQLLASKTWHFDLELG